VCGRYLEAFMLFLRSVSISFGGSSASIIFAVAFCIARRGLVDLRAPSAAVGVIRGKGANLGGAIIGVPTLAFLVTGVTGVAFFDATGNASFIFVLWAAWWWGW